MTAAIEVRPAATVMLVRDGEFGLETFMLRRNPKSEFVPGQFVFPGGALDVNDQANAELDLITVGLDDVEASKQLGIESGGLAYWVAAVRECFEEAGTLLARTDGEDLALADPHVHDQFQVHREAIYSGKRTIAEMCRDESLTLNLDALRYVSHWITPIGPTKRFDTRFFVARSPEGQRAAHDGGETVESCWIAPKEAMKLHHAGKFEMILPTVANLEPLVDMNSVDEVMRWANELSDIPEILPAIVIAADGSPTVLLPGDAGYEDALSQPPPPGSTR